MGLVAATRLQAQHISFWLRTLSNMPSIQKGYYTSVLLPLPKEMTLDEDINTSAIIIPSIEILVPITPSRAQE
jgi:hypothetical protein